MTRYHFDLGDRAIFIEDAESVDLLDIAKAQIEAVEFLGDVVKDISMREVCPAAIPCRWKSDRRMKAF
jgi:hypothetical protein